MKSAQWLSRFGAGVWRGWPEKAYGQQRYQLRLSAVQKHLAECLDIAPAGSVHIVSMCAGDGRDVIGVLGLHQRRRDATAWLVELDRQSVAVGVRHATSLGLQDAVHFLKEDATTYVTYKDIGPADIVLACGVWGHVPIHERALLVRAMAALCRPGGTVVWTRGISRGTSRLQEIQSLFAPSVWERIRVSHTSDRKWAVVTHRYCGPPNKLPEGGRIFHFQRSAGR